MNPISRRRFVAIAAGGSVVAPFAMSVAQSRSLTAQQVVDRIKDKVGVGWRTETVDTFKAGDPATAVTGIATTTMATLEVLRRAVRSGANLIVTAEPTFYSRADASTPARGRGGAPGAPDPILEAKNAFIRTHGLVIFRFSDHWRRRTPDPLVVGLGDALGWSEFRTGPDAARLAVPATTLDAMASDIRRKLDVRGGLRVVGDPRLRVQRVGLLPGTTAIQAALQLLPQVDAIVAGEVREWETVEYARDKVTGGEPKALLLVGRVVSEEPGMKACADWIRSIVAEVPTTYVPAGDPYWRPL